MDFDLDDLISIDDANNDNELLGRTEEAQPGNDANRISANINDDLQYSFDKLQKEKAESFHTMNSPDDFFPESTTTAVNLPPCSETQTIHVSSDDTIEEGPIEPGLTNNADASTNFDSLAKIDPLTGEEAAIYNDNGEIAHIREPPNIAHSKTSAGPRFGKYKPKPKAQTRKLEHIASTREHDVGSVQHVENIHLDPSKTDSMENEHVPMFTPDEILGASSIRATDAVPTETISDYTLNVEQIYLEEISKMVYGNEGGRSSEKIERRSNKTFELIDEPEDEGYGDDLIRRNETNNDKDRDGGPESQSLKERKGSQSKKSLDKTKKPARKRKKAGEAVPSESTKPVKKKFIHSTKRNKRQVNQELLKIPEDELELHMHNVPIRDVIRLREHKERLERKEASTSGTTAVNQSSSNPFDEDEAYAHGEGSADGHDNSVVAQNATHYNYGTHMRKRQAMKWTKQDTELFYEAIQQFGTDLSMIKECFPGRTREQIKAKYKKEERRQPLRLNDALTTRAEGTCYFKAVIARLKQAQAEEYDEDDPMNLVGENDEEGLPTHAINESVDATKPVQLEKEVKDMEPDVPAVESPTKSHDSEDEMYLWSQYKSEI
ncbi:Homeodomain-like protein [Artemisia annua]|uniref:Homeodomain-like protein n=1 Tax=Artemisia annua TaxID=35608 RepID=A0A2U1LWJ0_ARTAN|nr:Homeodomain-like protein [Artemisia annua]